MRMSDRTDRLKRRFRKPKLNPSFIPVKEDENTYHLRAGPWTGSALSITDTQDDEQIERLFSLFDGTNDIEAILDRFDDEDHESILSLVEHLADHNVLYDGAEIESAHGAPQFLPSSRFQAVERTDLETTETLVINAGSLGSQVVTDLLDTGVGTVRFAQPLEECRADVTGLDSRDGFQRVPEGELADAIADVEAFLYVTDREYPALSETVNRTAHEAGTPWMCAQRRGFDGLVGPTFFPGETGCYRCLESRIESNLNDESYTGFRRYLASDETKSTAALPSFDRLIAGYATTDFLHLLAYGQSFTVGRAITVSSFDLSVAVDDLLRLPRCPTCGKDPGDDVSRFLRIEDLSEAVRLNATYADEG